MLSLVATLSPLFVAVSALASYTHDALGRRVTASIDGQSVAYDAAGNLVNDEAGREYTYDEQNRLTEVRDASDVLLASYTHDALGRRVTAAIGEDTTRYYYDGRRELEERDAADTRLRYHVNGGLFVDERIATFADGGALTPDGARGSGAFRADLRGESSPNNDHQPDMVNECVNLRDCST